MTVKNHAASMSYVNVGYKTEVVRLCKKHVYKSYKTSILRTRSNPTHISPAFRKKMWILGRNKMPSEDKVVWMFETFFR